MVGFTLEPREQHDDDRHSVASTVATTTSLASRIRDLNLDFGDKLREHAEEGEQEEEQKEHDRSTAAQSPAPGDREPTGRRSEEASVSTSVTHAVEDDLSVPHSLHLLHRDPPLQPLQVCLHSCSCAFRLGQLAPLTTLQSSTFNTPSNCTVGNLHQVGLTTCSGAPSLWVSNLHGASASPSPSVPTPKTMLSTATVSVLHVFLFLCCWCAYRSAAACLTAALTLHSL